MTAPSTDHVRAHLELHLGPAVATLDATCVELPDLALLVFAPPAEEPDEPWTVATLGMSARPMTLPAELVGKVPARAELLLRVPTDPRTGAASDLPWPLAWQRAIARLPHAAGSWLGHYHTVPNGDPPQPLVAGTGLAGFMLVPPPGLADGADLSDGVAFYGLLALHASELVEAQRAAPALLARLIAADVDDVLELDRPAI